MKKSFSYLLFLFLLALTASAFLTTPAYADDEPPPAGSTDAPVVNGAEDASSDEGGEDASQTETQPASPEESSAAEEAPPAEALSEVPAGTDVVVVNAEGEVVPLATEEAADAIAFVDPVWCPVGVAPQNGAGGCTNSYGSLKDLVDALMAGTAGVVPNTNGVIWIQAGADASTGPIVLDGSDPQLGNMETFSLTLQGGWNGTFGSKVFNPAAPSTFTRSISIINWLGDITLNDITISGVTTGSATNSAALDIETTKKITLNRVNVNNNSNPGAGIVRGAWLDNQDTGTTGSVTVTLSNFSNNEWTGLTVYSNGAVTLSSVVANGNGDTGLYVESNGAITLSNATASGNGWKGADLKNGTALTPKNVTLTGVNTFNGNGIDGLSINTKGAITLSNVTASNNGNYGTFLDNTAGTGSVTLTGVNAFNGNSNDGLYITSKGAITLSNVTASDNSYGAYLTNTAGTGSVTLTGVNTFNGNSFQGLAIYSKGAITLSNVTASDNVGTGAYLENDTGTGSVTLTGINTFSNNGSATTSGDGLRIYSKGSIILNNVTAEFNQDGNGGVTFGYGAFLDNTAGTGNVKLTGANAFNGNSLDGLRIFSNGAITLSNVTASDNLNYGALLDNNGASTPQNVTLTGVNTFNGNSLDGLHIFSNGAITLSNVTASGNGNYGALLDNDTAPTPKNVTLTGVNAFNGNGSSGLRIYSKGAITLSNVTASDNVGIGAYLDNDSALTPQKVTLTGVNAFNGNGSSGLRIFSKGAITLSNVTASDNGGNGAYLDNDSALTPQNVTLTGINTFSNNGSATTSGDGLRIYSKGSIILNNVTAEFNQDGSGSLLNGYGAYLDNTAGTGSVTLTGVNTFNGNSLNGLRILSNGAITLSNVTASDNGFSGAYLENNTALTPQKVTLTGANFIYNGLSGLFISSKGNVSVTKSIASFNGSHGVYVNTTGSVTMTCGSYIGNTNYGLVVTGGAAGAALKLASIVTALNTAGGVNTAAWTGLPPVVTVPACP